MGVWLLEMDEAVNAEEALAKAVGLGPGEPAMPKCFLPGQTYSPSNYNCYSCVMPQLNFYVPQKDAEILRSRADAAGLPLSRYIAKVVLGEQKRGWPVGYFETTAGSWDGNVVESTELPLETRTPWK